MAKSLAQTSSIADHLFTVKAVDDLDVSTLLQTVREHGFAAVRGLIPREDVRAAYARYKQGFDTRLDNPGGKEYGPRSAMENFQKVIIGGGMQQSYYVPRFLRIFYNPLWDEDRYGMHAIFRKVAQLRNHIQGYPLDYAIDAVEKGFWTAARLQQYPVGGGFFGSHQDAVLSTTTEDAGILKFIQILLLITQRGEDFETGGAYVEHHGEVLDLEAECGSGDIVIYDGRSVHGVADIDPHILPDLSSSGGRLVGLASLYAEMKGDDADYAHYRKREYHEHP